MRIAITGASGLIGGALADRLTAEGHDIVRVVRAGSGPGTIRWDPVAGTIDAAGLEGCDGVVHLAGAGIADKRWTDERRRVILESRTLGTGLLARTLASLDRPPRVLLSGSAIGYYGERGDEVLTEASPRGTGFLSDVCVAWEGAAAPAVDAGIRTAFLRTGIVMSAKGGALGKVLPLFKLGVGGKLGSGRQWWSWISIADEVGAIAWLLEHEVAGPVNLTAPAPATNGEWTKALGHVLGRPTFLAVPKFGPKLLLGSDLGEELLFMSSRVEPAALQAAGFHFEHSTLEAGLRSAVGR